MGGFVGADFDLDIFVIPKDPSQMLDVLVGRVGFDLDILVITQRF
jgi:hypothetical protein